MNKIGADPKKAQVEVPLILVSLGFQKKNATDWVAQSEICFLTVLRSARSWLELPSNSVFGASSLCGSQIGLACLGPHKVFSCCLS